MQQIAGFIGRLPADTAARLVTAMASAMLRGPYREPGRCSIPDLGAHLAWVASEAQPHLSPAAQARDLTLLLVAGDCVTAPGVPPPTSARGNAQWSERLREREADTLASVNGFFAGVFVDRAAGRTLLFTDRHGIERLYASETADGLYFASQAKALLRVLPHTRAFDPEGLAEYVTFGCTTSPRTLFRDIRVIPQAARWAWDGRRWEKQRYFDASAWEGQDVLPRAEFERAYAETFRAVVPEYFGGDARVGLAATGGLDTRMILAARPASWRDPIAYTYTGPHDTHDARIARALSDACAIPHEAIKLDEDFLRDFPQQADRTVVDTDGAHGVTGSHESFLSERVRQVAPVRLTGVFGGEVLRGLSPWRRLRLGPHVLDPDVQSLSAACRAPSSAVHPVTAAAFGATPAAMQGVLASCRASLAFRTPFLDARLVQLAYRSPRGDAASEQSTVRMLLDHLPLLPPLATDRGRQIGGRRHLEYVSRPFQQVSFKLDYIASESLAWPFTRLDSLIDRFYAPGIVGRHKYLRYRRWFRCELADYVRDRLDAARRLSCFRGPALRRLADDHVSGAASVTDEINLVLTLEAVDRLLLHADASDAAEDRAAVVGSVSC